MRPYIGAVMVHEDRDIAHHPYPPPRAVTPQRPPLFIEGKLQRASSEDIVGQLLARLLQSSRLAVRQVTRPLVPAFEVAARAPPLEAEPRKFRAASNNSGIFCGKTRSYSTGVEAGLEAGAE